MIDFRDLLRGVNAVIATLLLVTYPMFQESRYVNNLTLILGLILALQVHVGLSKRRTLDPLSITLLYYITTYYTLRILTLAVFDHSHVFDRYEYNPEDTNYALVFIMSCNACLLYGFSIIRNWPSPPDKSLQAYHNTPHNKLYLHAFLIILLISVAGATTGIFDWVASECRILGVLIFFIRPTVLFLLAAAYLVSYRRELPVHYFVAYLFIYLIFEIKLLLNGTRGGIVYTIEMFAVLLMANGIFSISKKLFFRGLFLMPILLLFLFVAYNFASLQRGEINEDRWKLEIAVNNFYGAIGNGVTVADYKNVSAHILSRVGFLDFSAEIIAHKSYYESIFKTTYYAKSLIDNILSPGVDFFDTPKVSHALIFKHQNLNEGQPSKTYLVAHNIYHSDQLGIFGEMYALFGWYSLPLLFLFAYSLKWAYCNLWFTKNYYENTIKKIFILVFFINCINSFGIDWIIVYVINFIFIATFLIFYLRRLA